MDELGLQEDKFLSRLAPEPWDMSADAFWEMLQRHKASPIKATILDQSNIAGVGNIYADEGCFYAKILPWRRCGSLEREEADLLLEGLCKVMQASIDSGGSTMKDYVRADGTKGSYLEKFAKVFRRDGLECERCGGIIERRRVRRERGRIIVRGVRNDKDFYGNDRQKAQLAVDKLLGKDYELIEAENIERGRYGFDFSWHLFIWRDAKILLKDLNENKDCWELFRNYLDTTHNGHCMAIGA